MKNLLPYLTEDVKKSIREAIDENHIHFLEKDREIIGFHTWEDEGNRIFINNLWIEKEHRNNNNLLSLRKYFREKYPSGKSFYWRNRKKREEVLYV